MGNGTCNSINHEKIKNKWTPLKLIQHLAVAHILT